MNAPPLSLYVHLPWCVRKCPYCDFNSHALRETLPAQAYTDALLEDLEHELQRSEERRIESVFLGGGTPSLFPARQLARILERLRDAGRLSETAEVTLEANPGAADSQRFHDYHAIGINRLSIGVQSFDDACLAAIGRIHDGDAARRAIDAARQAQFDSINIDLMYGLPGQTPGQAIADVQIALDYLPDHVSQYQLTLEPGTVFYKNPPDLPDDQLTWQMLGDSEEILSKHGYQRYEVSALAQPGHRCRHNLNYWTYGDYLGIGAGAHGKLTLDGCVYRDTRPRPPTIYMQQPRAAQQETVSAESLAFEFMLNALRLRDGVSPTLFEQRTGQPLTIIESSLQRARHRGLLDWDEEVIRPTGLGFRFLNDLQEIFLPVPATTVK